MKHYLMNLLRFASRDLATRRDPAAFCSPRCDYEARVSRGRAISPRLRCPVKLVRSVVVAQIEDEAQPEHPQGSR